MKQKLNRGTQSRLMTWTLRAPLKFGVICAVIFTILALVFAPEIIGLLTPFVLLFASVFAIRGARTQPMERASYVAVDNALTILAIIGNTIGIIITPLIPMFMIRAFDVSRAMHVLAMFVLFTFSYYLIGLVIMNLYAVYLRMVKMGVSRWKIIFSMPFSTLFLPAYFLNDARATKTPVVTPGAKWYARLTQWIIARPINAIVFYGAMVLIGVAMDMETYNLIVSLTPIAVFVLFMLVTNPARRRAHVAGALANISVLVNIVLVLYSIIRYIG